MTPEQIIAEFLDENVNALDPGMDEIAHIIWNKMLEEHSCCSAMTFVFKEELNHKMLDAVYPAPTKAETEAMIAAEDAENAAKGLI